MKRDFLTLSDLGAAELQALLIRASELKRERTQGQRGHSLTGKTLGMIFEKASTRTRVSFDVGMYELGGHAVHLAPDGTQIGRGELMRDTARVLGGYCHGIVIRTFAHTIAEELAHFSPVPVINGLTDLHHPCQVLADLLTIAEHVGFTALQQLRFAWIGDGNNMANSWIEAAALLGLELVIACPEGYDPAPDLRLRAGSHVHLARDPREAARNADVLSTDVWTSMGDEAEAAARRRAFRGFCIDELLLQLAHPEAVVLHCLPAHRGEEITDEVLESPRSLVWAQAENRLHVQKALLERLLGH